MDKTIGDTQSRKNAGAAGHYERKQLLSKDRLIAWSHRSRFATGLRLARFYCSGRRVLDYGCGDGTFLAKLMDGDEVPTEAVGAELTTALVEDCRNRHAGREGLKFVLIEQLDAREHAGRFDLIVCMEVLEHVVDAETLITRLSRLVAPGGRLIASVPVETGPPLVIKQFARRIAGWRGIGDYPGTSPYTFGELCAGVFAGPRQHIARPAFTSGNGERFYDHKGFNWRRMRARLTARFDLEMTVGSPFAWLPPHLASQVWFVLRNCDENP